MAKKQSRRSKVNDEELPEFDVYEQEDGALAVLSTSDTPETDDAELVWSGHALNESEAIVKARKSSARLRKAPAANAEHEPDVAGDVRQKAQERVNRRLGITTRPAKRKGGRKKTVAKSRVKKTAKRKTTKRKSTRR
jgi:hypothetical protein